MIPPILHAFWHGDYDAIGWLRHATLRSWARLHPEHIIRLYHVPAVWHSGDVTTPEHRQAVGARRADIYRWNTLFAHGGWWTDLDVIYWRSPCDLIDGSRDCYLTSDGADDQPYSIGLIGAQRESPTVAAILYQCDQADAFDYQACGARAVARADTGRTFGGIPHDTLYVRPPTSVTMHGLWMTNTPMPATTHGLHWYAGHPMAQRCAPEYTGSSMRSRSPVWQAIERAGL